MCDGTDARDHVAGEAIEQGRRTASYKGNAEYRPPQLVRYGNLTNLTQQGPVEVGFEGAESSSNV